MRLPKRLSSKAIIVLAAIAILFPNSARVLCVAPGLHVQEEDINAPCPAASGESAPPDYHPVDGFNAAANWRCIDIFLTPYGRGAVLVTCDRLVPQFLSDECPGSQPLEFPRLGLEPWDTLNIRGPGLLFGSGSSALLAPLRC
jgi:hypothetical protein